VIVIDGFVDIATTDVWTAAGIRAMEFAVEAQKLLGVSLEGSVG
jgi:hypothetical protein